MAVIAGMVLLPLLNENFLGTWAIFLLATACHIYANYRAVTCLILEQFNSQVAVTATIARCMHR